MALDPDIKMLILEIEANVSHLESITHGLTREQLNWRPEPGRWSVGECVQHLNLTNVMDLAELQKAVEKGRAQGPKGEGPFTYGFLANKLVSMVEPPIKRRFKAPKTLIPATNLDPEQTVAEYRKIARQWRDLVTSASGLHLQKLKVSIAGLPKALRPLFRFPLGARFAMTATHDRRHLWQAEQVRLDAKFPG